MHNASHLPERPGVYELVCLATSQRYVGSSANIRRRASMHKSYLRNRNHTSPLVNEASKEHGSECWEMKVIELTGNFKTREKELMAQLIEAGEKLLNDATPSNQAWKGRNTNPSTHKGHKRLFTDDQARAIYLDPRRSGVVAGEYGCSVPLVSQIRGRTAYSHATRDLPDVPRHLAHPGGACFAQEEIVEIRKYKDQLPANDVGEIFGCSGRTVNRIWRDGNEKVAA